MKALNVFVKAYNRFPIFDKAHADGFGHQFLRHDQSRFHRVSNYLRWVVAAASSMPIDASAAFKLIMR